MMEKNTLIIDKGLLIEKGTTDYSTENSYKEISNLLMTIKEYRGYADPETESWMGYILDFFSLFKFSLVQVSKKLSTLHRYGSTSTPSAVIILFPAVEKIFPPTGNFEWELFLFYAAKFHQTQWGILFNGRELQVFDCADEGYSDKYTWVNLEEIIFGARDDCFFSICKLFSLIRAEKQTSKKTVSRRKKLAGKKFKGRFPQSGYRMPILNALIELNGKGKASDILARVYEILEDRLGDVDLRLITGGEYYWRNTAQWERLIMRKEGLLKSDSPRGFWEISELGKKYFKDHLMDEEIS